MGPSGNDRKEQREWARGDGDGFTHANGGAPDGDGWLRSVMENSTEIVKIVDPDGTLRYASPAFGRVFGYDPGESVGTNMVEYVHPDDLPRVLEETERALDGGGTTSNRAEYRFRHKDGSWRWVESIGTYLPDDPNVGGVVVNARDITERKEAEVALRESEERFRRQYENLPVPTYTWRRLADDYVLVDHNDAARRFTGDSIEDLLGSKATELLAERPALLEMIGSCFRGRATLKREMPWRKLGTGEERRLVATCAFVPPDLVMVHTEDVTERAKAGERLRFQAQLLGAVGEAVIALDTDRKVVYWNREATELYGFSAEEVLGRRLMERVVPEDLRAYAEEIMAGVRAGLSWKGEFVVRRADGARLTVEATNTPTFGEDGGQIGVVGVLRDVTERKQAEEALRRSEAELFSVLESITDGFFVLDEEWRFAYVNPQAVAMLEWDRESLIGEKIKEDRTFNPHYRKAMAEGRTVEFEGYYPSTKRWYGVRAYPSEKSLSVYFQDITERKVAEARLRESEERFRGTFQDAPIGVALVGLPSASPETDRRYLRVNRALCEMLGYSEEDLLSRTTSDVTHEEDLKKSRARVEKLFEEGGSKYTLEKRYVRADGRVVWVLLNVSLVRDSQGRPSHFVSQFQDVTKRKETEEALRRSEERYRTVVEEQAELVCRFLPDLTVTFANEAYCRYFGVEQQDVIGKSFLERVAAEDRAFYEQNLIRVDEKRPRRVVEHRVLTPDGGMRWQQWTDTAVFGVDGRVVEYQSVGRDVTERKALEERLEHQALHDSLTGLPNRRLFVDRLGQALEKTRRREGSRSAVLFMDLDNFKGVNDSLGHEVGDLMLTVVAQRLKRCLRPEDTLARFGGDEFVVLIEDVESPDEAARLAERIAEAFGGPFRLDGRELYARASTGIALGDARTKTPEDLLRNADTAMYRAKETGGGYEIFDPTMHGRAVDRLELENGLRRAIDEGEFVVHYQPIVRLDDGRIFAVEALVRWEHPERGLLNPDEFVPVAEESGLVVPMGERVLEEACRRARTWQDEYPEAPMPIVSVNLSARQLGRHDLAEVVEETLGSTGLEARCLSLDVTETVYVRALEENTAALSRLRSMGVGVSIDDFGMGYSSLSYLKRLPADALKIDKSFVKGLGEDVEDTAIVQTIIELAHTLGLEVVAEGVETEAQTSLLREMGCDFGQGFYFARPLPPDGVSAFLNAASRGPAKRGKADSFSGG